MAISHPSLYSHGIFDSIGHNRLCNQPAPLVGLHILVVDDERDARNLLAKVLKNVGAIATVASSVDEALQIIDAVQPQMLISDIGMPIQDGYDLVRLIRKGGRSAQHLPAIAVTAFSQPEDIRRAILAGFQMHVAKPIDPYELITIVEKLAGQAGIFPQPNGPLLPLPPFLLAS